MTGFNAADPDLVSVHWLVKSMHAEEQIDGDRAFRSRNGYEDLINIFRRQISDAGVSVRTGAVVDTIRWTKRNVEITGTNAIGSFKLAARRALVTLPLGVLRTAVPARQEPCSLSPHCRRKDRRN